MHDPEVKQQAIEWLLTSDREPKTKAALCRKLKITVPTLHNWEVELKKDGNKQQGYDSMSYLELRSRQVDEALIDACEKNNASALKIYYQLTQRLIEQSAQVKIELTADDIAKLDLGAERRAREFRENLRMEGLQERPAIFSGEIREDKGRGEGNHSLPALAVPD